VYIYTIETNKQKTETMTTVTFKDIYNKQTVKLGVYLTIGRRWVTVYQLEDVCFTESLGLISISDKESEVKNIEYQEQQSARMAAWFKKKSLAV
jgi:hypothetical protein